MKISEKLERKEHSKGERHSVLVASQDGDTGCKFRASLPAKLRVGREPSELTFAHDHVVAYNDLPHVSTRIRNKLASSSEYVKFEELLADNRAERPGTSGRDDQAGASIESYETWYEAFHVFLMHRAFHRPSMMIPLLKYANLIAKMAKTFPVNVWSNYDKQFRLSAASRPNDHVIWTTIDPMISSTSLNKPNMMTSSYQPFLPAREKRRANESNKAAVCYTCQKSGHIAKNCPGNRNQLFRDNEDADEMPRIPICYMYNDGLCRTEPCPQKRSHICARCDKPGHPKLRCKVKLA